jgi:hypothetical protein
MGQTVPEPDAKARSTSRSVTTSKKTSLRITSKLDSKPPVNASQISGEGISDVRYDKRPRPAANTGPF